MPWPAPPVLFGEPLLVWMRRGPPRRQGLVDRAVDLVRVDGLDGKTVRRVQTPHVIK